MFVPEWEESYAAAHSCSSGAISVEPAPCRFAALAAVAAAPGTAVAATATPNSRIHRLLRKVISFQSSSYAPASGPAALSSEGNSRDAGRQPCYRVVTDF